MTLTMIESDAPPTRGQAIYRIEREHFQELLTALRARGYQTIGPAVRDGAIVYDEVTDVEELPIGWEEEQNGGYYRLRPRGDEALFGYTVGPQSWKQYLRPPIALLWRSRRTEDGFEILQEERPGPRYAFIGVRACELTRSSFRIRIFLEGAYVDGDYKRRREATFILAVDCGRAASTCFCSSMGTGPEVGPGFDLALTEIVGSGRHYFVVDVGSETRRRGTCRRHPCASNHRGRESGLRRPWMLRLNR